MIDLKKWHASVIGQGVITALKKNKFKAEFFPGREEALAHILDIIPSESKIGIGGSATLREIGIIEKLRGCNHILYDHNALNHTAEEKKERRYQQLTCEVFLSSSNAVTLKGELINIDCVGNRVNSMTFGPGKIIIAVGINKVVRDIEEGLQRIRLHAAPLNTKRHESPNPCLKTGQCSDCSSASRICNITTIIHKCPPLSDIEVVVIGESLGF